MSKLRANYDRYSIFAYDADAVKLTISDVKCTYNNIDESESRCFELAKTGKYTRIIIHDRHKEKTYWYM